MIPILKNLSGFYDVRTEIPKFVVGNTFIWNRAFNWLHENCLIDINIANRKSSPILIEEPMSCSSFKSSRDDTSITIIDPQQTQVICDKDNNENYYASNAIITESNHSCSSESIVTNTISQPLNYYYGTNTINKPNININIINGSYNKIIFPADRTKNILREEKLSTKDLISDLKISTLR